MASSTSIDEVDAQQHIRDGLENIAKQIHQ
jgi:hypothetical protein